MAKRLHPDRRAPIQARAEQAVVAHVHDQDGIRHLRFSHGVVHSSMRLTEPDALELSYSRAMMGFLLFNPEPRHILIAGLGGGSLTKYCYRRLPRAQITSLEIDPAVIALRDEFLIPPDDQRHRVVQADACAYLAGGTIRADAILLDACDATGLPECLGSEPFYANCRTALGRHGVLAVNFWGDNPGRRICLERLQRIFEGRVCWSQPGDSCNLVAYAFSDRHFSPDWAALRPVAQQLEYRYGLDFPAMIDDMQEAPNPGVERTRP